MLTIPLTNDELKQLIEANDPPVKALTNVLEVSLTTDGGFVELLKKFGSPSDELSESRLREAWLRSGPHS